MHIKVKQFSLRKIVFSILLIVMLLLSCLAGTLLVSTNQNRNLVNQYVSETVELYVSQLQKEMDVMRVELINILESNEATNELPDYFNSESSKAIPILKKISDGDERIIPRFGRQNFEKILDNDERITQDLADEILKKFWMTMSVAKGRELWQNQ